MMPHAHRWVIGEHGWAFCACGAERQLLTELPDGHFKSRLLARRRVDQVYRKAKETPRWAQQPHE